MGTPLQRERQRRSWSQEHVADRLRQLDPGCGIDANTVSRHERGLHMPRASYQALYAKLFGVEIRTLFPRYDDGMERRVFLQALAAAPVAAMLPGADASIEAVTNVTGGYRRLEATTPAQELRGPVAAHLRFVSGRLDHGGRQLAAVASEVAGFAAWLAVDQCDHPRARRLYGRAIESAQRSGSELLVSYMLGSEALWMAESGEVPTDSTLPTLPDSSPPTAQAWLAAIEAMTYAAADDADDAFAALKRAEHAVSLGHDPQWPWLFPFDAAKLAVYVGACATKLKMPRTAIRAFTDALPNGRTKQRALILADLSANYTALGQHNQARAYATEATSIGRERASMKVLSRLAA